MSTSTTKTIRQIQRPGGQAITGAFSSAAGAIAEAEAHIRPVKARQWDKAAKIFIDLCTLSANHPIACLNLQPCKTFRSPLQRIGIEFPGICREKLKKIEPYIVPPWEARISYKEHTLSSKTDAAEAFLKEDRLLITIAVAANEHGIAYGIAQASRYASVVTGMRLDSRKTQSPYTTALEAIAAVFKYVCRRLPSNLSILVTTSNLSVLQVLSNPARQSRQCAINSTYKSKKEMEKRGIKIQWQWVPIATPFAIRDKAKEEAHKVLKRDINYSQQQWAARSTVLSQMRSLLCRKRELASWIRVQAILIFKSEGYESSRLTEELINWTFLLTAYITAIVVTLLAPPPRRTAL